jgi:hypothetical protein
MTNVERTIKEMPIKRLEKLRKDIAKYDEYVNKCDIAGTNILAESIGSDMDFLKYTIKPNDEQKREMEQLENIFSGHMNRLQKCRCVKKIEK